MSNYDNPWREKQKRMQLAAHHDEYVRERYAVETAACIRNTIHYPARNCGMLLKRQNAPDAKLPDILVVQEESVTAAFNESGKVAILNFASYKTPGGMYIEGSIAQEESLCHASNLYPILSSERLVKEFYDENRRRLNKGLYNDNLLYTPDVIFEHKWSFRKFNVITAAAPNKGAAQKYSNVSDDECAKAMQSRIQHILMAAIDNHIDTIILGAYGCGVFRNDPEEVAQIFKRELVGCPFKAVFAVPGEKYNIFSEVLA